MNKIELNLKPNNIVEKRNVLNEMRPNNMSLVEMRFFAIYLSKINARDQNTRVVRFPLSDFVKILEIQKVNISAIEAVIKKLLGQIMYQKLESGGNAYFQIFKSCVVDRNEKGEWFVEIDAHDKALPLMFEFKRDYFKYELWNELRLKSANQMRMYEILKQYEFKGERTETVENLKFLIGIPPGAYTNFSDFRRNVLDKAKKALVETTDIDFSYEFIKKGRGAKVVAIRFTINKNENFVDQTTIPDFIETKQYVIEENMIGEGFKIIRTDAIDMAFLAEAFCNEFNVDEVEYLYRLALPYLQWNRPNMRLADVQIAMFDYFQLKYSQLKAKGKSVKRSRYGLLRSFIEADAKLIGC